MNRRRAFSLIELLVAMAIFAVLTGIVVSAVVMARATAAKSDCANNLRQIGIALTQYHDQHRRLPMGVRINPKEPLHRMGWQGPILPYLEKEALWDETKKAAANDIDVGSPLYPPCRTVVKPYSCPLDAIAGQLQPGQRAGAMLAYGSYCGNAGIAYSQQYDRDAGRENPTENPPSGVLFNSSNVPFAEISDGLSNTLLAGERPIVPNWRLGGHWYFAIEIGDAVMGVEEGYYRGLIDEPPNSARGGCRDFVRYGPGQGTKCDNYHFWSYHKGGAHFLFADGAVKFLTYGAEPAMKAFSTRNRGDSVPEIR